MNSKQNLRCLKKLTLAALFLTLGVSPGFAQTTSDGPRALRKSTQAQREAAAVRAAAAQKADRAVPLPTSGRPPLEGPMKPGGVPDYFGNANWAFSPVPTIDPKTKQLVGGMKKFVDTLPGVGAANANNLGQFIPIAIADTTTYPGCDYYQIGIVDYTQQMHSGLPPTRLRGYIDLDDDADGFAHYMGPLIIAKKDRPVRLLVTNMLANGTAGKLFIPVDTTVMGAGMGPMGTEYTQNRTVVHLHGGATPWISDGTPHQWFTPAGEVTKYPKGASFQNVPDMLPVPDGSATYYYTNQQSNRLMFYHDHAYGTTRLNVYAGEAAGYLITDPIEDNLIDQGLLPGTGAGVYRYGIPLVIQDRTFVDTKTIPKTDPTWNWGTTPPVPNQGDLWFPHVYLPYQNPDDPNNVNPFGRWDYGPWAYPPFTPTYGPIPDPLKPGRMIPGTPNPSMVMESFMDTPIVNGCAYPKLAVQHQPYRFRILNACNDRMLNLQLYYVDPKNPTEVKMVPAVATKGFPPTWPTDGRDGGVPDPKTAGPQMIQLGTEGGFLSMPVVLPNQPVSYAYDPLMNPLNVTYHTLLLGPAERADVIIDFSKVTANAKIILYNDAPAPFPGFDPRFDYYTGASDLTSTGGAPTPLAGYGPNTRTIMLFEVAGTPAAAAFNLTKLQAAWPAAYAASQVAPIVPETTYPAPYKAATDTYSGINSTSLTYTPAGSAIPVTTPLTRKALQEDFELDYGRGNATLGVMLDVPAPNTVVGLGYISPVTEILTNNGVQLWKIHHNGVDSHAIHVHLFNAQLINRVAADGTILPPDANELGWKETVRMNPQQDTIIALQPAASQLPFAIPESIRPLNPAMPAGDPIVVTDPTTGNQITVPNAMTNYGWEYVWHCHLLGHEEMDMMRPMALAGIVPADYVKAYPVPYNLSASVTGSAQVTLNWFCNCPPGSSHRVERAPMNGSFATIATLGDVLTYTDNTVTAPGTYMYRVFAFNGANESLPSNVVTVYMVIPAAPKTLAGKAAAVSSNVPSVNLTWVNNATNETGLHLQRAPNALFQPAATTTFTIPAGSTAYTDATAAKHAVYCYRICTFNGVGSSAYSNVVTVVTNGQTPLAPAALTVTGTTRTTASLSWTPAANSIYTWIYRSTAGVNGPWTMAGVVPNATATFKNIGLTKNTNYWYCVKAYNADGYSVATPAIPATTLP